jgi:hypothetical protein
MNLDSSETIISTLNGQGLEVFEYPDGGMDEIAAPGFYFNHQTASIEHWSLPCDYNNVMQSHFSNKNGIIQDGFQSVLPFEDIMDLSDKIKNWNEHLIRYGVV